MTAPRVRTGLEVLIGDRPQLLRGKKVGLVTHQSAVTSDLQHAVRLLHASDDWQLTALFGPEHGIWGDAQDMVHVTHSVDPLTGLPVYSLYGESVDDLKPDPAVLKQLDVLVVDLQDVGSRYYTFVNTMALCMREAAAIGLPVIVLDRPNPIDGVHVEGNFVDEKFYSFVGMFPIPARHGMTAGELACYFNKIIGINCDLTVVEMDGWRREMWFDETGLTWVIPSPNMPTVATATVYPGMCLVEGTNLSEGRGTTHPFEIFGAPWLEPFRFADRLNALELPGVRFRPHFFTPTFQKHAGRVCGGAEMHVNDRNAFEPFRTGLWCVKVARDMNPEAFDWRRETYEFVSDRLAIDLLAGNSAYRDIVERGSGIDDWAGSWDIREFMDAREDCLLYR